jgi:hypothetical protein
VRNDLRRLNDKIPDMTAAFLLILRSKEAAGTHLVCFSPGFVYDLQPFSVQHGCLVSIAPIKPTLAPQEVATYADQLSRLHNLSLPVCLSKERRKVDGWMLTTPWRISWNFKHT